MFKADEQTSGQSVLPWVLLEGEVLADAALINCDIQLSKKNQKVNGKFYLTNFRLFFKSDVS